MNTPSQWLNGPGPGASRASLLFLVTALFFVDEAAGQPVNDDFADRIPLNGTSLVIEGSNVGATLEPDEDPLGGTPSLEECVGSVWWTWTAPVDGRIQLVTARSSFDTQLRVFTGSSLTDLELVAYPSAAAVGARRMHLRMPVTAGTIYTIMVAGDRCRWQ